MQARHHRQVIRGDAGQAAPVHVEAVGAQAAVPVDPVEREERQRRGMRAADAGTAELAAQRAPDRAREPLVEIAHHDARAGQLVVQDVLPHQHADLRGPLADLEAEVHVEDVQQPVARHLEVQPDAAAGLAVGPGEVERAAAANGQTGEDRVAVGQAVPLPRGPHRDLHAEALGEAQGLGPEHLLQAHQVGVDLLQHLGDPVEVHAAVEPRALVDVVAGDG